MGDRIGRNGRLLGKRAPNSDRLDDEAKKRLFEISGINDDDIEDEERDELVRALLESNPDFLKEETSKLQKEDNRGQQSTAQSQSSSITVRDDQEEDATQPPDHVAEDIDSDIDIREECNECQEDVPDKQSTAECCSSPNQANSSSSGSPQAIPSEQSAIGKSERREHNSQISSTHVAVKRMHSSNPFEEDGASNHSEKSDEQTQLYSEQLVQETQRSEKSEENETDIIIPESPDNSNGKEETPLLDRRFNMGGDTRSKSGVSSQKSSLDIYLLLRTLNPLLPSFCCKDSNIDKDCYSQVVKLIFDLYRSRVRREQRRMNQSINWGQPVGVGSHMDDCLRLRGSKKAIISAEAGEGCSRKNRLLRRHGNEFPSLRNKEDPYVLNVSDEDKDVNDFQTQSYSSIYQNLGQNSAEYSNEQYAYDASKVESSRKSARLCNMKLAQSRGSESDENEGIQDEWVPERSKCKTRNNLKRKVVNKTQQKNSKAYEMVNVLEKEVENTYSLSKESRNITEGEVCQQSKEISNLESLCSKKDEQICPKTLIHGRCKGSSEKCPSPLKKKYKFNSDSEDEVNQQKVYPDFDFSADRDEQHLPQKVIVVSDSEQSNDVERIEKANSVSRHSSKQAGVLAKNILTPAAQPIKPQKRVDQDVLVCSKPDPQGLPLSGVSVKRPSTKFQSKVSRATALSTKNKNATAFDSRKEVVQDQTDGPSWSQGSNSLLDEDGLLYSTQPLRQKRNVEKHGKSTETLALVPEEMETLESKKIRDFNSLSTTELKGSKDLDRKRKAPITRNPISKRQAPGSIISWGKKESLNHEKNGGEATDENNFDTFSSLRNTRCDKSSVNSNREEKSSYLSEDENELDEKGNGTTKLLRNITSHKHTADEVRQARDEDQELQLPSGSNDATQDQRQASFLEELNNEVDEKALQACPICSREFPLISIEAHASTCGEVEVDQDQQELDQKCNYCGERFMNNAVFQDHVNKCDLRRRQTRSRRVDQRLH